MRIEKIIIVFGVLVILIPLLGIPLVWKNYLCILFGGIIVISALWQIKHPCDSSSNSELSSSLKNENSN